MTISADRALQLRAELLSNSPNACVARELWSSSSGTYSAYRECILARKQLHREQQQQHVLTGSYAYTGTTAGGADSGSALPAGNTNGGTSAGGVGGPSRVGGAAHSLPATVKYSFEGVKHVLAESSAAVSAVAFAPLRSDLLAFGCMDGELWLVGLPAAPTAQTPPAATKARKMHGQAIQSLDWAYDGSQLLSVGHDGSLCVWDATDPAGLSCIRSVAMPTTAFLCGRFHRVNFSLAMVGSSAGYVEVFNCSTGMSDSRYKLASGSAPVQVTALDSSNHHVFAGDSSGHLHLFACELHGRQLSRLRPTARLRLVGPGGGGGGGSSSSGGGGTGAAGGASSSSAVTALQYVAFCGATDSPVLLAALQDGSLCIVRANETRHTAELHLRRAVSPPSAASMSPYVYASAFTPHLSSASHSAATPTATRLPAAAAPGPPGPTTATTGRGGRGTHLPPPAAAAAASVAAAAAASAALTCLLRLSPCICPLSAIHDVPLITYGSDDMSVYILDVTGRGFSAGAARGGGGAGGGGAAGAAAAADRPLTVTVLKAHRAPVACVAWSFDESLLASADADGMVVIWQRCRLF